VVTELPRRRTWESCITSITCNWLRKSGRSSLANAPFAGLLWSDRICCGSHSSVCEICEATRPRLISPCLASGRRRCQRAQECHRPSLAGAPPTVPSAPCPHEQFLAQLGRCAWKLERAKRLYFRLECGECRLFHCEHRTRCSPTYSSLTGFRELSRPAFE
jgi:hypothetical protein